MPSLTFVFILYVDKLDVELLSIDSHAPLLQGHPVPAFMYVDDVLMRGKDYKFLLLGLKHSTMGSSG